MSSPATETLDLGPAYLPVRPYKPSCHFGCMHLWITNNGVDYQCSSCGSVDSAESASKGDGDE